MTELIDRKTSDKLLVLLEVDGKLYQVALSDTKRAVVEGCLQALFDGPIKVVDQELPIEIIKEDD